MEPPQQLSLSNVDSSPASDEQIVDLLKTSRAHLGDDNVRALFYANDAFTIAATSAKPLLQLKAALLIIEAMTRSGRAPDAVPFVQQAVELTYATQDQESLDGLIDLLGRWSIEAENTHPGRSRRSARTSAAIPAAWLASTIAGLDSARARLSAEQQVASKLTPADERRAHFNIDDAETGLLNGRGLAAELLNLEQQSGQFALIQITVVPDDSPISRIATIALETTGTGGILSRNGRAQITIVLPFYTGVAAMTLAERLKNAFALIESGESVTIGIGVAIKQPGESAREVLRRVTDRAEEAAWETGIFVVG